MPVPLPDTGDRELLSLIAAALPAVPPRRCDILVAGRQAWTWRTLTSDLAGLADVSGAAEPPQL